MSKKLLEYSVNIQFLLRSLQNVTENCGLHLVIPRWQGKNFRQRKFHLSDKLKAGTKLERKT